MLRRFKLIGQKFDRIVLQANMHRLTLYFQDGGHDVRPPLAAAYASASSSCALARRVCETSLLAVCAKFLIHSIFVLRPSYFFKIWSCFHVFTFITICLRRTTMHAVQNVYRYPSSPRHADCRPLPWKRLDRPLANSSNNVHRWYVPAVWAHTGLPRRKAMCPVSDGHCLVDPVPRCSRITAASPGSTKPKMHVVKNYSLRQVQRRIRVAGKLLSINYLPFLQRVNTHTCRLLCRALYY